MDEQRLEEPKSALIYELFQAYAEWTDDELAGGIPEPKVLQLLQELDLLEGIPAGRQEAYAHEVMLRADVDHDGVLGINEFFLWFQTELVALLPLKRNGTGASAPLYNRFVSYALCDSGAGVRRKVFGMHLGAFLRLLKDQGIADDMGRNRIAAQVARSLVSSDRTNGKMEGGARMQFAQFVQCLQTLSESMRVSLDATLYRVVGDGSHPPTMHGHERKDGKGYHQAILDSIKPLLQGEIEDSLRYHTTQCSGCGGVHRRWMIGKEEGLKALLRMAGVPYLPQFRNVNTPNARSVFHQYCAAYNKGVLLPGSQGRDTSEPSKGTIVSPTAVRSIHVAAPGPGGPCCCQKRSMGLMEMQTFWTLLLDLPTMRSCLEARPRPLLELFELASLTSERVDAAFLTTCSIEGVYHSDSCPGIHDKPVSSEQAKQLTRSALGITAKLWGKPGTKKPAHYGTPFEAALTMSRRAQARVTTSHSAVRLSTTPPGNWTGSAMGTASPITLARKYDSIPGQYAHRPATPTLTFPQFLEAVRLIAEDIVGHPQTLAAVELAMMVIIHEMSNLPCPFLKGKQQPKQNFDKGSPLDEFYAQQWPSKAS